MYRLKISRKDKEPVLAWFETIEQLQIFREFIESLINAVKAKTTEEIINQVNIQPPKEE